MGGPPTLSNAGLLPDNFIFKQAGFPDMSVSNTPKFSPLTGAIRALPWTLSSRPTPGTRAP
jgi:hypothetical protein